MASVTCVLVRFDADMARVQDEAKYEKGQKEKAIREKDMTVSERIQLEQEIEVLNCCVKPVSRGSFSRCKEFRPWLVSENYLSFEMRFGRTAFDVGYL